MSTLTSGDKISTNLYLSQFKERNKIQFPKLFAIPMTDRIPELSRTEEGRAEIFIALLASIKSLFGNINLRVGLNEDQMISIADQIIEESHEDNLSLEDFLLFGQKFLIGEYGKIYDRMDIPTFFEFFEKYRQYRYEAIRDVRDQEHAQSKVIGRGPNLSPPVEINRDEDPASVLDLMQTLYQEKNDKKDVSGSDDKLV